MQLQQAAERFKSQGIGLAAISYDTQAILKDFAERQHIAFPLLADPQSEIISKYQVLNAEAQGMTKGMPHPGFFYIDSTSKVKEKFFETAYTERYTANNLISKLFPELGEQVPRTIDAPHISLKLQQSDQTAFPGSRLTLMVDLDLPPGLHVYAPGAKGYIPIEANLDSAPELKLDATIYPQPKMLFLPAIKETAPVFGGKFRIAQDVTISADRSFSSSLGQGKTISIKGQLKYQACDEKICYAPVSTPLNWDVQVVPLDRQRSPAAIQHR